MHMAVINQDQSLILKALDESGRWTAVHLISYEHFVHDKFYLLLCAFLVLLMLAGIACLVFYPFKKIAQDASNAAVEVERDADASRSLHLQVPEKYRAVFVQTMEEDLAVLKHALAEGRARAVLAMLHRMHGALAALGLDDFAGRCEVLGRDARLHGMTDEIVGEISALERDLIRILRWQ